ncbi:MAG: hypothetical protein ACKOSS_05965 [Planctomycetia bacterium]
MPAWLDTLLVLVAVGLAAGWLLARGLRLLSAARPVEGAGQGAGCGCAGKAGCGGAPPRVGDLRHRPAGGEPANPR